tara:strand:- start:432 stop:836 length:405 start_codon:yes stop_codon:yes gene_type:complete
MKLRSRIPRARRDEELTPLINVVFLLLIFVVLAGEVVETAPFPVSPPDARGGAVASTGMTSVYLGPAGQIFAGGRVYPPGDLAGLLAALPETKAAQMTIEADRAVDAVLAIALVEHLQKAGVKRVRLVTSGEDG